MSTTATKRTLREAWADAVAFRDLVGRDLAVDWHLAGSLRRKVHIVSDVDYVVIPKFGDIPGENLFAIPAHGNLIWHRLEQLLKSGEIAKATYGASEGFRWGDKLRGIKFRGFTHEILTADADNLGSQLAIKTGPADFSKRLVIELQKQGYWNNESYVWNKRDLSCSCGWTGTVPGYSDTVPPANPAPKYLNGQGRWLFCPACKNPATISMARMKVPDEQAYFRLCGMNYILPEDRK